MDCANQWMQSIKTKTNEFLKSSPWAKLDFGFIYLFCEKLIYHFFRIKAKIEQQQKKSLNSVQSIKNFIFYYLKTNICINWKNICNSKNCIRQKTEDCQTPCHLKMICLINCHIINKWCDSLYMQLHIFVLYTGGIELPTRYNLNLKKLYNSLNFPSVFLFYFKF